MLRLAGIIYDPMSNDRFNLGFEASRKSTLPANIRARSSPVIRIIRGESPENFCSAFESKPFAAMKNPLVLCAFPRILTSRWPVWLPYWSGFPFRLNEIVELLVSKSVHLSALPHVCKALSTPFRSLPKVHKKGLLVCTLTPHPKLLQLLMGFCD